jgi:MOSC domain-containing protein YiiM
MSGSRTGQRGTIESVNVGEPRIVETGKRRIRTAIWKSPVTGTVPVRGVHVGDDVQANTKVHGGRDKAVYAYGRGDYDFWERELGERPVPGNFGENLTIAGLDVSGAVVGERWRAGSVLLEVSEPRLPCSKLGLRMGDPRFPKRFGAADRPGAYLRIIEEGELAAGDQVEVVSSPDHGVTVALASRIQLHDHARAAVLLAAPELPEKILAWARERAPATATT